MSSVVVEPTPPDISLTCLIAFESFCISAVVAPEDRVWILELSAVSMVVSSVNPIDFAALANDKMSSIVAVGASVRIFDLIAAIDVERLLSGISGPLDYFDYL